MFLVFFDIDEKRGPVSPRLSLKIIYFIEEDNNGCSSPFLLE